MLIRGLGDVALTGDDGRARPLTGNRQSALLAALAARAGEVVPAERLVDLLWGDETPHKPAAALHSAVFKVRARLAEVSDRDLLRTPSRGYLLDLAPGDLDAQAFTTAVADARGLEPAPRVDALRSALGLWRGRAYGELADSEVARLEAIRLEELRLNAVEQLGEALHAAGRPAEAVTLLQPFVAEHHLREPARGTLMRSLHAEGRAADALEQFQGYRKGGGGGRGPGRAPRRA